MARQHARAGVRAAGIPGAFGGDRLRSFLAGAVESPGEPYDEQLRMLRTLEELQPDYIRIVHAMLYEPTPVEILQYERVHGSPSATLSRRLPNVKKERLTDLVLQLGEELKLVTFDDKSLHTMMTRNAAEDLRDRFTRKGKRLVAYVRAAGEGPA